MKALYLTPGVFDKGGISRYNRYQVSALRDLCGASNVAVLSLLGPSGTRHDLETPFTVDWHGSGSLPKPTDKLAFILKAAGAIWSHKPDVIWCGHLHFAALAHALARLSGATDVVQVYGYEVWTPRRRRPDAHWGMFHADHVVSDCHATAGYVEQHYPLPAPVEVMWDPVDTDRFTPGPPSSAVLAKYQIPDPATSFNVMTLGRISQASAYKGYARLLEVFAGLPAAARLIYGGGGDLAPQLQAHAQRLGVADRVTFTGFIDEDDLADVYRSASLFCLIADSGQARGEGIPLTPLEAAACGAPILVGNQDGSREAVEQGVNGFALDPFDLGAIAQHIRQLMGDEIARRRMGEAGRQRVVQAHAYPVFRERMRLFLGRIHK